VSIRVELADLADEVTKRGPGYLLTTREDGRPHAIEVSFGIEGDVLEAPSGRTTGRNIAAQPLVAVLFAPTEPGGYSLIIDGDAAIEELADGSSVARITATSALLHRPAER